MDGCGLPCDVGIVLLQNVEATSLCVLRELVAPTGLKGMLGEEVPNDLGSFEVLGPAVRPSAIRLEDKSFKVSPIFCQPLEIHFKVADPVGIVVSAVP